MNNDEIKALLRELKARSDESNEVKGKAVKINFGEEEPPAQEKSRGLSLFSRKKAGKPTQKEAAKPEQETPKEEKTAAVPEQEILKEEKAAAEPGKDALKKEKAAAEPGKDVLKEEKAAAKPGKDALKEEKTEAEPGKDTRKEEKTAAPVKNIRKKKKASLSMTIATYFDDLKAKGIGEKELIMLGAGAVLIIFLVFVIYSAIFSEDKSVNVTADDGLYVTVEEEPENWCSESKVVLGIRAGAAIQSIMVNGKSTEFDSGRRTTIAMDADTEILDLMIVTEEKVLNAQVEIPMIDSENPSISIRQENGQVTLDALDARSGLEGVYYGTMTGFSDVPRYQRYTGPFTREPGKLYYYYAQDNAGNRTVPAATNMDPAQVLTLSETEVTLFPGNRVSLRVKASPENAYCNDLQMINQNPEVVSLSGDGTVTALKDGDAVIEASAEGLPSVSCVVHVRSEAEVTITAVGDCTLGDDVNFNPSNSFSTVYAMYGYTWFFQNVKSIFEADDITFANFEGVLTTADTREIKQYAFKGDPQYTSILKDGSIEAVTLANNHSRDYGAQSLEDTKQYLTEAGIDYCIGDEIIYRDVKGVRVALIGIYVLDIGIEKQSQVEQTVTAAKQNGADLIVVGFHWGSEKSNYPDEVQQSLAHTAIDCGADLVVGHHPHVLQGIEQYQGKYIVYSLGNFCFGGNSAPTDTDTMIFQQTFSVNKDGEVTDSRINIIPCSITSQSGWNSYQPTPQEGAEAERIMGRINEYSAQFGLTLE